MKFEINYHDLISTIYDGSGSMAYVECAEMEDAR
jgi:hypothetical protein